MVVDAHKNFAYSQVATAPSPAISGTSLIVASGDGTKFPTPPFNATTVTQSLQILPNHGSQTPTYNPQKVGHL